jgi:biopolymer transport protein ExbD
MKFPRNARIFRGQLEVAPFASVFFLLLIFFLLSSRLYNPGVRVELPPGEDLPGTDQPTIAVAVDAHGQYYFDNQLVPTNELLSQLQAAVKKSPEPLTLVVQADKAVAYEKLISLGLLTSRAGITNMLYATLPRVFTNIPSVLPGPP